VEVVNITMTLKFSYENILYLALGLVSIFIIYKLFTRDTQEGFQSIINKFKNARDKNTSNKNKSVGKKTRGGSKVKVSFDDLVAEAEDMDPSKYTVDNIKNNFFTYLESFQKAKFQNVSGTTDEALEKFGFFKDKFFDIFK
jgi:hypothetical protein